MVISRFFRLGRAVCLPLVEASGAHEALVVLLASTTHHGLGIFFM